MLSSFSLSKYIIVYFAQYLKMTCMNSMVICTNGTPFVMNGVPQLLFLSADLQQLF